MSLLYVASGFFNVPASLFMKALLSSCRKAMLSCWQENVQHTCARAFELRVRLGSFRVMSLSAPDEGILRSLAFCSSAVAEHMSCSPCFWAMCDEDCVVNENSVCYLEGVLIRGARTPYSGSRWPPLSHGSGSMIVWALAS